MKKKLLVLSIVLALLFVLAIPALAGPPQTGSGLWLYIPALLDSRQAGCNTFLTTFEDAEWTETLVGQSTEEGKVTIHCNGKWSFKGSVSFEGEVAGKSGTLEMLAVGGRPDGTSEWDGKLVILGGTGELANLRGQGRFWGPGWLGDPTEPGVIYYELNYHFEP
jgi:hypothetical protein